VELVAQRVQFGFEAVADFVRLFEQDRQCDKVFRTPGYREHQDGAAAAPGTFMRLEARLRDLPFPASYRPFVPHEKAARTLRIVEHSLYMSQAYRPAFEDKLALNTGSKSGGLRARGRDVPTLTPWSPSSSKLAARSRSGPATLRHQR
jgi:hypothetical protein